MSALTSEWYIEEHSQFVLVYFHLICSTRFLREERYIRRPAARGHYQCYRHCAVFSKRMAGKVSVLTTFYALQQRRAIVDGSLVDRRRFPYHRSRRRGDRYAVPEHSSGYAV